MVWVLERIFCHFYDATSRRIHSDHRHQDIKILDVMHDPLICSDSFDIHNSHNHSVQAPIKIPLRENSDHYDNMAR